MRRAHGHDQDWRSQAACALPQPHLPAECRTVTSLPFEEAEQIVRRQVWTTDTLGPLHVKILGRTMKAAEVEQLAMMVCNACAAQHDCALYALAADEQVGTWAIPQSWLVELRRMGDRRAAAVIESARSTGQKVQAVVKAVLFGG